MNENEKECPELDFFAQRCRIIGKFSFLQPPLQDPLDRRSPREIHGGGRVRDSLRPHSVHKRFVVTPQFNILQTRSVLKRVVRYVQNMIRLVIGQVLLQRVHLIVHGGNGTQVPKQLEKYKGYHGKG